MSDRYAVILGAMKCGTTALYAALCQHPDIARPRDKEPNFLNDPAQYSAGLDQYRTLWDAADRPNQVLLEASTNYTKLPMNPTAAFNACNVDGDFRFVYVVRNPVDRIKSHYVHAIARGWFGHSIEHGVNPQAVFISNYRLQLMPYEAVFGRDRILVLTYAEICSDIRGTARRVCDFVGVNPFFEFRDPGPQNSATMHKASILQSFTADAGINGIHWERYLHRYGTLPDMVEALAIDHPRVGATIRELADQIERWTTPTADQAAAVLETLRPDLDLFTENWGVDPRTEEVLAPRGPHLVEAMGASLN